jgi:hypothetical protein
LSWALVDLITRCDGDRAGGRAKVSVQVTIDLPTLLGLRDNPAELAGYGPLAALLARALAADGKWRRLIHDPHTGALLDLGRSSYTPSAELTRYIHTRDAVCGFPGCNRAAHRYHLDHTHPYKPDDPAGGGTDRNNLGPLCEHHHRLKHRAGWVLRRDPTGRATWTSPLGHRYAVDHHDYRSIATRDDQQPLPDACVGIDDRSFRTTRPAPWPAPWPAPRPAPRTPTRRLTLHSDRERPANAAILP